MRQGASEGNAVDCLATEEECNIDRCQRKQTHPKLIHCAHSEKTVSRGRCEREEQRLSFWPCSVMSAFYCPLS